MGYSKSEADRFALDQQQGKIREKRYRKDILKKTMKHAIRLTILSTLVFSGLFCSASPNIHSEKGTVGRAVRFTILQINDVYKIEGLEGGSIGGIARVRTLRKQLEAEGRKVIVLHAGDILFPSVMSKYLRAQPMVRVLNLLDGDPAAFDQNFIAVFGNHEFDDKDPGLILGRIAQSDFSWVSSNVRYRSAKDAGGKPFSLRLKNVHDVITLDVDDIRVGIFGLTIDAQSRDYVAYDYDLTARRAAVRAALDYLKSKGTQVNIALTHQSLDQDELLASDFPEINLIVGGHEHFFIQRKVGNTWVTKADADARSAVVYDMLVAPNAPVVATPRMVVLDKDIEKDPLVETEVQTWVAELSRTVKEQTRHDLMEVLGTTKHTLEGVEPAVRGRETALGNFLADVIRDRMKTDLAFVNGGGIRINDNIPPGPIRTYDMEGIFYFDNMLTSFEITGKEILDILRNSVSKVHLGDGRFLQVSGIRFKYHVESKADKTIYRIETEDVEVKPQNMSDYIPLEPDRKYSAGSTDYLWQDGYYDGYGIFSKGNNGTSPQRLDTPPGISFRAAVEEAIASLPDRMVTSQIEGRITMILNPSEL